MKRLVLLELSRYVENRDCVWIKPTDRSSVNFLLVSGCNLKISFPGFSLYCLLTMIHHSTPRLARYSSISSVSLRYHRSTRQVGMLSFNNK